jgi:4-hydroxy-tetrahydrodipicolinate synthase
LLTLDEHKILVDLCVNTIDKKIPVIVGAGGLTVDQTLAMVKNAETAGADGVLIVTPYYIKPSQEALFQYYKKIHDESSLPIILYNNPGRAGVELSIQTILELSRFPRIVGLKDSSTDINRATKLRMALGDSFLLLSGDDFTVPGYLAHGGDGAISVASNIAPRESMDLLKAWNTGNHEALRNLSQRLLRLSTALFAEGSPSGPKFMAHLQGFGSGHVRAPLTFLSTNGQGIIEAAFEDWASENAFDTLLQKKGTTANEG